MTLTNPQVALLAAAIATLNPKNQQMTPYGAMSVANDYMDWLEGYAGYND